MEISIHKLLPSERALAGQLIRTWLADEGIPDPRLPSAAYLEKILRDPCFHVFVALRAGQVIGGLTAYELPMFYREERELFLYEIGVSESFRRQGVARRLIDTLKQYCREERIPVIFVGTAMDNQAARALYRTTGGTEEVAPWYTYELNAEG